MSDHEIVIHVKPYLVLFLTDYVMAWTHKSTEKIHRFLILPTTEIRQWIATMNIISPPPNIHGMACKKKCYYSANGRETWNGLTSLATV